jgi:CDP-diacylglycerol--glycerol-3-phosphate 3-phosphatidyltransferase
LINPEASSAPTAPGLVNLPNGLTVLRLALVPVFVMSLLTGGTAWRIAAFVVFAVASITDLLDGELARRNGLITDFGKLADPIADKALTGSALITLSALGELSWWVTGIIMVREIGVTLLRFWVIRHGVIPASRGGKIKTVLQMLAIGLYVLPIDIGWGRAAIMAAAVVVTLVTGADYVRRAVRLRRVVPRHRAEERPASGPVAAGPIADGAMAAGPIADGAMAAGPIADGAMAAGPIADGAMAEAPEAASQSGEAGTGP